MTSFGNQVRVPDTQARIRRNSVAWQDVQNLVSSSGAIIVNPDGTLAVQVAAPVIISSNSVTLSMGDGITETGGGAVVDLATNSGLTFSSGQLLIDLDTNPGLALGAGGLSVSLASNSGLTTTGGLQIDLDGSSLSLGAGGLSVTNLDAQVTVTAVQTGTFTATIGSLVRYDASGGTFTINLPTAVGIGGRSIEFKESVGDTTGVTVDADGSETIDGAATLSVGTSAREYTRLTSDNTNWMVTT